MSYGNYNIQVKFNDYFMIGQHKNIIEWNRCEKSCIFMAIQCYYESSPTFKKLMDTEYNKVVITHPLHTNESGEHFTMVFTNDTNITEKPRSGARTSCKFHGYFSKKSGVAMMLESITQVRVEILSF